MAYEREIATAQRLIKKACKNRTVKWCSPNVAVADPATPWIESAGQSTKRDVYMAFVSQGDSLLNALLHLVKGTDVPAGGPKGLLAGGLSFTPQLTDYVENGTEKLQVASIDPVRPDGITPVLYKVRFA